MAVSSSGSRTHTLPCDMYMLSPSLTYSCTLVEHITVVAAVIAFRFSSVCGCDFDLDFEFGLGFSLRFGTLVLVSV